MNAIQTPQAIDSQTIQALNSLNLNYQRDRILDVISTADTLSRFAEAGQGGEITLDCECLDRMLTNICDDLQGVANYLSIIELAIPNPCQSHPNDYTDPYDQPAEKAKEAEDEKEEEEQPVRSQTDINTGSMPVCPGANISLDDFYSKMAHSTTVAKKRMIAELASGTGRFYELPKVTPPTIN